MVVRGYLVFVVFVLWMIGVEVIFFFQRRKWFDEVFWVMGYVIVCLEFDRKQLSKDDQLFNGC